MSVLIIAEHTDGAVKKATYSAINFGKMVAQRIGADFNIAIIGHNVGPAAQTLAGYGAANIYTVDDESCAHYIAQPHAAAASAVAQESDASWVVAAATATGFGLLPRVAVRLEAGLASNVTGLAGSGADVKLVRPMYSGKAMAVVEITTDVKVVSVPAAGWDVAAPTGGSSPITASAGGAAAAREASGAVTVVGFQASGGGDRPDLNEADIVVAGGRGLKGGDQFFTLLDPLVACLGAGLGASRAVVDAGWTPNDFQIGQTGKSVAPNLYFAIAISGAIQHLAGMKNSKFIVAINKDEEAPIFDVADYGLVADAFVAVPQLVELIKADR